jgi:NAD(P)-dependent dehydrogenase (short-subunit alcohol dehydrogenase family)
MAPSAVDTTSPAVVQTPATAPSQVQTQVSKFVFLHKKLIFLLTVSVILVTGANRGTGLGIAECCLSNGATKIYSIDITQPDYEFQIISKQFPGRLFSATADVTKEESIQAAVDTIITELGALHGMILNAGRTNHKSALEFTQAEIEALFNVNVICISN